MGAGCKGNGCGSGGKGGGGPDGSGDSCDTNTRRGRVEQLLVASVIFFRLTSKMRCDASQFSSNRTTTAPLSSLVETTLPVRRLRGRDQAATNPRNTTLVPGGSCSPGSNGLVGTEARGGGAGAGSTNLRWRGTLGGSGSGNVGVDGGVADGGVSVRNKCGGAGCNNAGDTETNSPLELTKAGPDAATAAYVKRGVGGGSSVEKDTS